MIEFIHSRRSNPPRWQHTVLDSNSMHTTVNIFQYQTSQHCWQVIYSKQQQSNPSGMCPNDGKLSNIVNLCAHNLVQVKHSNHMTTEHIRFTTIMYQCKYIHTVLNFIVYHNSTIKVCSYSLEFHYSHT